LLRVQCRETDRELVDMNSDAGGGGEAFKTRRQVRRRKWWWFFEEALITNPTEAAADSFGKLAAISGDPDWQRSRLTEKKRGQGAESRCSGSPQEVGTQVPLQFHKGLPWVRRGGHTP